MAREPARSGAVGRSMAQVGQQALRWRLLGEVWGELGKVTWPSREQTMRLTVAVIAISMAVGLGIGVVDFIFTVLSRYALGG
ncbi:MAG: preprotein translocase subunit SecE [Chloroflexi bacterium]|nr:preprotein translocase subunit SecE [Chloroflexota bacterium]